MAHKRFTVLSPVRLYKEDLLEQKKLLREHLICEGCNFTVNAVANGNELSAKPFHSVEELLGQGFPSPLEQLTVDARMPNKSGDKISKSIRILFDRNMADLRVYSDTDHDWVEKTSKNLNAFFDAKKPWYGGLKGALAPLFNITMVGAFFLAWMAWQSGEKSLLVLPAMLIAYSLAALTMSLKNRIFPYCSINLVSQNEEGRTNYELLVIVGWLLLLTINAVFILI